MSKVSQEKKGRLPIHPPTSTCALLRLPALQARFQKCLLCSSVILDVSLPTPLKSDTLAIHALHHNSFPLRAHCKTL